LLSGTELPTLGEHLALGTFVRRDMRPASTRGYLLRRRGGAPGAGSHELVGDDVAERRRVVPHPRIEVVTFRAQNLPFRGGSTIAELGDDSSRRAHDAR
jgi:hypothetical protein